ncbi:hypothetical protein NPIL_464881 [Nephila pilipes]|uniref:Uncharacterized protein n=1 Tax=Nephila pilipes TaxID=299642 RepID=A0A8X6J9U9_NEPPI|nr:hypothetical protein NPIL_464881 [Nephila pilipes]
MEESIPRKGGQLRSEGYPCIRYSLRPVSHNQIELLFLKYISRRCQHYAGTSLLSSKRRRWASEYLTSISPYTRCIFNGIRARACRFTKISSVTG